MACSFDAEGVLGLALMHDYVSESVCDNTELHVDSREYLTPCGYIFMYYIPNA